MKNNFTSKELIEAKKSNSLTGQMKNFTKYEIHKIYNELLRCKELSFTYWYSEPFDYRARLSETEFSSIIPTLKSNIETIAKILNQRAFYILVTDRKRLYTIAYHIYWENTAIEAGLRRNKFSPYKDYDIRLRTYILNNIEQTFKTLVRTYFIDTRLEMLLYQYQVTPNFLLSDAIESQSYEIYQEVYIEGEVYLKKVKDSRIFRADDIALTMIGVIPHKYYSEREERLKTKLFSGELDTEIFYKNEEETK